MPNYDLIIIGGGPIGLAVAIEAQANGLDYLILEKGYLVNSLYHYPLSMTFFSSADKLEIGGIPFISQNTRPTRAEALEYYRRVALSKNLKIHLQEGVEAINGQKGAFKISTPKAKYQAKNLVIATGFFDQINPLKIPGEELDKVAHYYRDPHPYFGQKVAVIGAANSAVDAALELWRKGAHEVSMIIREEEISPRVKYWVRPDALNRIKEGSIKAYFKAELSKIEADWIYFRHEGVEKRLANDAVLALTGYRPNFGFLEKLGLEFKDDESAAPIYDEESMESSVPGIYLAGVICGGLETNKWFIENSRVHAQIIIKHLKEGWKVKTSLTTEVTHPAITLQFKVRKYGRLNPNGNHVRLLKAKGYPGAA